jgi:hypothetical protein
MKYAVQIGSDAMIFIPSFIKTCSGTQKLMGGYANMDSIGSYPRKLFGVRKTERVANDEKKVREWECRRKPIYARFEVIGGD